MCRTIMSIEERVYEIIDKYDETGEVDVVLCQDLAQIKMRSSAS